MLTPVRATSTAVEQPRRDAAGAQGAQHRQPLFEGEADRRIDDEQPDEEGQQAERGEVEMETVGEAFEVGLRIGSHQAAAGRRRCFPSGARLPVALPISSREI